MNTPEELRYAKSHEWTRIEGDGSVTIGITDYAQDQLGDVVFVELPAVGSNVEQGEQVAVIESVKTASDIYAPVAGEITAINNDLDAKPETINESPYEAGWLFKLVPVNAAELDALLDAASYLGSVAEE
ncbi:MAG TPA: glycine cleavage system protein GcvH [Trueperaceae bacterium]|nr:glycine cleavage system protein GcvH [Trueperaceae bacterium]